MNLTFPFSWSLLLVSNKNSVKISLDLSQLCKIVLILFIEFSFLALNVTEIAIIHRLYNSFPIGIDDHKNKMQVCML